MFVERAVDKFATDRQAGGSKDPTRIQQFLNNHDSAKIIVIIDTHCLPNGGFIWKTGSKDEAFGECSLLEVRSYWIYPACILMSSTDT